MIYFIYVYFSEPAQSSKDIPTTSTKKPASVPATSESAWKLRGPFTIFIICYEKMQACFFTIVVELGNSLIKYKIFSLNTNQIR